MPPRTSTTPAPIKLTFFGDSTCVGQGVSIYQGWVTMIARHLDAYGRKIRREVVVSNSSINGRTTRQALEDMPYHIQSQGVDILVVQFGLNDCNHWASDRGLPRVSLPAFVANLQEIVARGARFGARKILLNNNHPTARDHTIMAHTDITYEASNRNYNEATRELARSLPPSVSFQDIEADFQASLGPDNRIDSLLLDDGLHLSAKGHERYFQLMCPIVERVLDDLLAEQPKA